MNKFLMLLALLSSKYSLAQSRPIYTFENNLTFSREDSCVFNYFSSTTDTCVYVIGWQFLMPADSVDFFSCTYQVIFNGEDLKIIYKQELLFKYIVEKGHVYEGVVYYPYLNRPALWGEFKKSKLHGLVISYDKNGSIMEIMKFRNGKYKYHKYSARGGEIVRGRFRLNTDLEYNIIVR